MIKLLGFDGIGVLMLQLVGARPVFAGLIGAAVIGAVANSGGNDTTVTNTPPPLTEQEIELRRLQLEELRRQNDLAAQMFPGQQALIELQRRMYEYQLAHTGDLDALHDQQLQLAQLQVQQAINDAAMQEQLRPQQLQFLQNQNALAMQQIEMMREATGFQREQNQYIIAQLRDQQARIDARNKYYSPEEEAKAAAEEARRATRMGAISEEAAQIQLDNLKRGNKPTEEQLANINEAVDAAQASGESDIKRFLTDTLRTINEEVSQASGLRPTDSPNVRLSERAGEEAARQQGNLTSKLAETRATARLNYPLAANKLESDVAGQTQSLAMHAADFQDQLRLAAAANRNQAFSLPSSVGFAMPQSSPMANLSFMNSSGPSYNPNAFNFNFSRGGGSQTTSGMSIGQMGQFASGIGSFMGGYGRMFGGGGFGASGGGSAGVGWGS